MQEFRDLSACQLDVTFAFGLSSSARRSRRKPAHASRRSGGFFSISPRPGRTSAGSGRCMPGMLDLDPGSCAPPAAVRSRQHGSGGGTAEQHDPMGFQRARSADAGRAGRWRFRPATAAARLAVATAAAASASDPPGSGRCCRASGPATVLPARRKDGRCDLPRGPGGSPTISVVLAGLPSANTRLLAVSRKAHPSKSARAARSSSSVEACAALAKARSPGVPLGGSGIGNGARRRLGVELAASDRWGRVRSPHRRPIQAGAATVRERHPSKAARKRSRSI